MTVIRLCQKDTFLVRHIYMSSIIVSYSLRKRGSATNQLFLLTAQGRLIHRCLQLWFCKILNQKIGVFLLGERGGKVGLYSIVVNLTLKVGLVPMETTKYVLNFQIVYHTNGIQTQPNIDEQGVRQSFLNRVIVFNGQIWQTHPPRNQFTSPCVEAQVEPVFVN